MGVPSFYRWLIKKYPKAVVEATEERGVSIDTTSPNPNGIEFDHLYLDMNGIIHPCFHPEHHPCPPKTFEDVFNNIFLYIDHLFSIVRPRKLLYMAIDGVAPRAKMNQQRSRRFRTAKDREISEAEEDRLRIQFEREGKPVLPKQECEVEDSNVITPGTEFMYKLSEALRSYISSRINNDPGWKDIKVILSDANVPGEGEHKIMSFVRQQRRVAGYNPDTRHCIYGLDADLIMLALATHEVHFSIMRENVLPQGQQPVHESSNMANTSALWVKKPYQFLHIWILREYLELDMKISDDSDPPGNLTIDLERIVDDFILMCFLVGNDFLPHMPSLEIHEGALDLLMAVYKKEFKNLGGYLVDMSRLGEDKRTGYVKLCRVEKFFLLVGSYEERIFKKRSELRESQLRKLCKYANNQDDYNGGCIMEIGTKNSSCIFFSEKASDNADSSEIVENTKELNEKLKSNLCKHNDLYRKGNCTDKVRFGNAGWKQRYYKEKFSAESSMDIENLRRELLANYTKGILWVLVYYYSGVPSWTWFYPYHYAPFASDMKGLAQVRVKFEKGSPFKPFDQLLAVLPPRSAHALPKVYQTLMTDEESSIIDLYPSDFDIDTDGKRFQWQGICKLPFIDEGRLLSETKELEKNFSEAESERNRNSIDQLYLGRTHKLASQIFSLRPNPNEMVNIDTSLSDGIGGFICLLNQYTETVQRVVQNIEDDGILCVCFEMIGGLMHIPCLLPGVNVPDKTITESDIMDTQLWHEDQVNRPTNRLWQTLGNEEDNTFKAASSQSPKTKHEGNGRTRRFTSESCPEVIRKGAGIGWSTAGRGKVNASFNKSEQTKSTPAKISINEGAIVPGSTVVEQKCLGSRWEARKNYSHPVPFASGLKPQVRPCGTTAQSMNNNFWRSSNGMTYDTNNTWRQSIKSGANTSNGHGRAQHGSKDSLTYSWKPVGSSMQGHGGSRQVPDSFGRETGFHG
ncbi:5'-3' exoribonuclease 3-like isoform X2 [Carya illinoinensis]|nr:5'-3' exoribonuclease 3-like isoform X2 [Carya illinoinensis]